MSLLGANYPARTVAITPDSTYGDLNAQGFRDATTVSASEISIIKSNGSNAVLMLRGTAGTSSDRYTAVYADGTAASYAAQSGQHVALTDLDAVTFYLNADLFKRVEDTSGGNSLLVYGWSTGVNQSVEVVGTAATIAALFATAIPDDTIPAVNVTAVIAPGTDIVTSASDVIVNITSADLTHMVNLPAASVGRIVRLFVGANGCTVMAGAGDFIDTAGSIQLGATASLILICTAANQWTSQVTQVGSQKNLIVQYLSPIDPAVAIAVGSNGGGVNIVDVGAGDVKMQSNTGDAIVESVGGDVRMDSTAGNAVITADVDITATANTGNITMTASMGNVNIVSTAGDVDVTGNQMIVPDGGVYFQTGTSVGLQGDGVGDEMYFRFNAGYPLSLARTGGNSVHGMVQEGFMNFSRAITITGAADPGFPLVRTVNEVTTNAATHGVLLDTSSNFVFITAGGGIAADVQVRSALGVVVDTIAAGVTKMFINFGGATGWKSFTL